MKSMKVKNIIAVSVLLASGGALADSYQFDLNAVASHTKIDGSGDKKNVYKIGGEYYFNPVTTANVPLAEAAFLGKNSGVYAGAARNSWGNLDYNDYSVGGELYIPESFLYVNAAVTRTTGDITDNNWRTSVGITPLDGLLVSTSYNHDEGYDANIAAKYVTAIGDNFINVEARLVDADDGAIKAVGADFYFDNSFSVGGGISQQHSDNTYEVRSRKFFTEQISGEVAYADAPDENSIRVGVSVRF